MSHSLSTFSLLWANIKVHPKNIEVCTPLKTIWKGLKSDVRSYTLQSSVNCVAIINGKMIIETITVLFLQLQSYCVYA